MDETVSQSPRAARRCAAAVLNVGGISHSPREFSGPEDIANGANVLLHTLLKLDHLN